MKHFIHNLWKVRLKDGYWIFWRCVSYNGLVHSLGCPLTWTSNFLLTFSMIRSSPSIKIFMMSTFFKPLFFQEKDTNWKIHRMDLVTALMKKQSISHLDPIEKSVGSFVTASKTPKSPSSNFGEFVWIPNEWHYFGKRNAWIWGEVWCIHIF